MTRSIEVYGDKVYGVKVSEYGLENGYLDYQTLVQIVEDCVLNNTVRAETLEDWELVNGDFDQEVYQDYIISENGYILTNEHVSGAKYGNCYVTLPAGKTYKGNVVWSDSDIDLQIVKINDDLKINIDCIYYTETSKIYYPFT